MSAKRRKFISGTGECEGDKRNLREQFCECHLQTSSAHLHIIMRKVTSSCFCSVECRVSSQEIGRALTHLRPAGGGSCSWLLMVLHEDSAFCTYSKLDF